MSEREISQEILEGAQNGKDWYDAYCMVGFTEEQALRMCLRTIVNVNAGSSPEMSEFMSRFTALINKQMADET